MTDPKDVKRLRRATDTDETVTAQDVEELRGAVVSLASRVTSLSDALVTVNEIQERQRAQEKVNEQVQRDATRARKTADALAETSVTKEEAKQATEDQLVREKTVRRETMRKVYTTAGIVSVFFVAIILGMLNYQAGKQGSLYKVCQQRNMSNAKVLEVLTKTDPATPSLTKAQQESLQELKEAFAVVDCGSLK